MTDLHPAARRRSDDTWTQVRDDYLAGASAPQLCERYDVGLTALRTRARTEGWRRTDAPDPGPLPDDELEEAMPAAELCGLVLRRLSHAVRCGRLREALGWERLLRSMRKLAAEEAAAAPSAPSLAGEVAVKRPEGVTPTDDPRLDPALADDGRSDPHRHAAGPRAISPPSGGGLHDPHDPHAGSTASAAANRAARRAKRARLRKGAKP